MRKRILFVFFTLAAVVGFSLNFCLKYQLPLVSYESPTVPFYVTENEPGYLEYKKLHSEKYWHSLSAHLTEVAKKYCKKHSLGSTGIQVTCTGDPTSYRIEYIHSGSVNIFEEYKLKGLMADLKKETDRVYQTLLQECLKSSAS